MRRRQFIMLVGGAVAWPLTAAAQGERVRRVGVLMSGTAQEPAPQSWVAAFIEELQKFGWTNGRNLQTDIRWNAGDAELAKRHAADGRADLSECRPTKKIGRCNGQRS
jgi:putative ABC transport system substrate-binding protein